MSSMSKYFNRKKESDLLDNPPSFYRRHLLSSCSTYTILILNSLWLIQVSSLNAMKEEEACYSIKSTSTQKIENQKTNYHEDHPLTREFWKTCDIADRLKDLNKKISLIKNDLILHKISLNAHIKDNLDNYKKILRCTKCSASSVQNLKDIHLKTLDSYIDRENPEKPQGWSANTEVILFPCKSSQTLLTEGKKRPPLVAIKKFKDEKDTDNGIVKGLTELICSLLALEMNPAPERLKMAQIFDAVICPQNSLSIIMEAVPGKDIHTCLSTNSATNVVKACAEYLALFHIENHQKLNKNINRREFLKHAANFSNSLLQDTLEEEHNIYKLLSLTPREQLSEDTDIKSHNVILLLAQEDQKKLKCLAEVSLNLFRKNTENIFRSLQNIAKKVPYFLTRNHGDAHIHNFFYDNSPLTQKNQPLPSDSFYRIAMIDFATIFNTSEQTGDPAEDVGRILAALRNWSIIAQDKCNKEEKVALLKREFIEHYLNKIKKSNIIEPENREDFERMLKENAVVYELRYYRAIFNVKKHHELEKDKEIKRQFLKSWIEENAALEAFSKELDQQNYFTVKANDRSWEPVCTYKDPIVHWLPDWSNEFIESPTEDGKISYLTSLWQMLNDTGTVTLSSKATLAGMGGIGKTTLALAYGHEALANNAYHLIYWIYSGTEHSLLKGYKELLLKMGAVESAKIPITEKERIIKLLQEKLPPRSLLIYDNVPEFYDDIPSPIFLKNMIPENKNTHILMTSRRNEGWSNLSPNTHSLNLEVFCLKDSLEYLFKVTGLERNSDNEKIAGDLAESLGHFPLALAHAAHYLKLVGGNNVTAEHFETYLHEFYDEETASYFENKIDYLKDQKSKLTYENLIARTLRVSENYLKTNHIFEPAKELLAYCSYLDSDAIQEEIFLDYWPNEEEKTETINKVFETLAALSLIKKNKTEPVFSIHRLVQLVIRGEVESKEKEMEKEKKTIFQVISITEKIFKENIRENEKIDKLLSYSPHFTQLLENTAELRLIYPELYIRSIGEENELQPGQFKVFSEGDKLYCQAYGENKSEVLKGKDELVFTNLKEEEQLQLVEYALYTHTYPEICGLEWMVRLLYYINFVFVNVDSNSIKSLNLPFHDKNLKNKVQRNITQVDRILSSCFKEKKVPIPEDWLNHIAEHSSSLLKFFFFNMYLDGQFVVQDDVKAFKWCKEAADQNFAVAQYHVGAMYEYGKGIENKDLKLAIQYYTLAADQDMSGAQNCLGLLYRDGIGVDKDHKLAFKCFTLAANQGYAPAQYHLGGMYLDSIGVAKDHKLAENYFKLAADQGYAPAQNNLGWMYLDGVGVNKEYKLAFKYFTLAANQEYAPAQCNLGIMYQNGHEVKQDYQLAHNYYTLAANQEFAPAQYNLGIMYKKGLGVGKSDKMALKYITLAVNQEYPPAQFILGTMYHEGCEVTKDHKLAFYYYTLAADQGNADTQFLLGVMYYSGQAEVQSYEKAIEYFRKAAEQGHPEAESALRGMSLYGQGGQVNQNKGCILF